MSKFQTALAALAMANALTLGCRSNTPKTSAVPASAPAAATATAPPVAANPLAQVSYQAGAAVDSAARLNTPLPSSAPPAPTVVERSDAHANSGWHEPERGGYTD
jgi:hypothetical protein